MVVTLIIGAILLIAVAVMVIVIDRSSVLLKYRGEKSDETMPKKRPLKLSIIIVAVVALLLVPLGMAVSYLHISAAHIAESGKNYPEEKILSDSGEYLLCTERIEDESGVASMTFSIKTADGEEALFICPDVYRAYDLKGIDWDGEDVVVNSSDVGVYRYTHTADGWKDRISNAGSFDYD